MGVIANFYRLQRVKIHAFCQMFGNNIVCPFLFFFLQEKHTQTHSTKKKTFYILYLQCHPCQHPVQKYHPRLCQHLTARKSLFNKCIHVSSNPMSYVHLNHLTLVTISNLFNLRYVAKGYGGGVR